MGEIKPSFDTNRQVLGKILPLDTPFNVIIDSSEACNFKCNYCFRSDGDLNHWGYAKDKQLMSWDIFTKVIEQIKDFPQQVKQISLSNHGEPLTNRMLPNMVRYIKSQGIQSRVSIHTNASLLDEQLVKELADSNIDRIVISLQGMNSGKYKEICGYDLDYEHFFNNIKMLYEIKNETQIYIKIANVALNEDEEQDFYRLFTPISDRVFVEKIVPIWKDVDNKHQNKEMINKYGDIFMKQNCCPLTFHTIVISPNGDVYPCTQLLSEDILGNINTQSLIIIWNSEKRKKYLIDQINGKLDICKDCFILQNSIYSKEDMIDEYRDEIFNRILEMR